MICGNTQAEIDRDTAQYEYERSAEHLAATMLMKDNRHKFVSDLLANNYHTIGDNTYALMDAIESIDSDEFWSAIVADGSITIGDLNFPWTCQVAYEQEPEMKLIEKAYTEGRLAEFHPLILAAVESLADTVIGELDE